MGVTRCGFTAYRLPWDAEAGNAMPDSPLLFRSSPISCPTHAAFTQPARQTSAKLRSLLRA
jgi:hypothetical protein